MTIKHIIITGLILIGFVNSVKAENDIIIEVTVKNNTKLDFNKGELSIMRTKTSPQKIKKNRNKLIIF